MTLTIWRAAALSVTAASAVVAAASSLPAAAGVSAPAAARAAAHGWHVVSATSNGAMWAVTASGKNDLWAFGTGGFPTLQSVGRPRLVRSSGSGWGFGSPPADPPNASMAGGIACAGSSSPTNVWAFNGTSISGNTANEAALRFNGSTWVLSKDWGNGTPGASYITGCAVISPSNVWAFGNYEPVTPFFGTWHYNGSWSQVSTPGFTLTGASAVSGWDMWGWGADSKGVPGVVAYWNGASWARNTAYDGKLPKRSASTSIYPGAVKALAKNNVYAENIVGTNPTGKKQFYTAFVQHWNGSRWTVLKQSDPAYYMVNAVSDGRGGWWSQPYRQPARPYLLHRSGGGSWVKVPLPVRDGMLLTDLVPVPGTQSMLASGWEAVPWKNGNGTTFNAVVLQYNP